MLFDASGLFDAFREQIAVAQLMLSRPAVQLQLIIFVAVVLAAWMLPRLLERLLEHLLPILPASEVAPSAWRLRVVRWLRAFDYALFPVLALIGLQIAINQLSARGWPAGLIDSIMPVFWLFLGYRLFVSVVLASVSKTEADRYLNHYIRPAVAIVILWLVNRFLFQVLTIKDTVLLQLQGTSITLGNTISVIIAFLVFYIVGWAVHELLVRLLQRSQAEPGVSETISNVSRWAILGFGVLMALGALGADLATLAWIGTGLSVGIGFGLQELFGNFVSGILLAFERSVRPGDIIETGGQRGTVRHIGMRATLLHTGDNVEVFVPNKELLTKPVLAYTYSDRTSKVRFSVGVDNAVDLENVRQLLLATVRRHPLILPAPPPDVVLSELGPVSVVFQISGSIADYSDGQSVKSELVGMVRDALLERGITMPSPRQDVYLKRELKRELKQELKQ